MTLSFDSLSCVEFCYNKFLLFGIEFEGLNISIEFEGGLSKTSLHGQSRHSHVWTSVTI